MLRHFVAGAIVALLVQGCRGHVSLQAPPPSAPLPDRLGAFQRLQPVAMQQTAQYSVSQYGGVSYVGTTTDYLQLNDGTRVYHPEDILPVVAEGSPAARSAEESASARSTASTLFGVSAAAMALGFVLMLLPLTQDVDYGSGEGRDLTLLWVGSGVVLAGLIPMMIAFPIGATANDAAAAAYRSYADGLAARLGLCVREGRVGDCHGGTAFAPGTDPYTTGPRATPAPAPYYGPPGAPAGPPPGACVPDCRSGFDCVQGQCVNACNPPCPSGQVCTGHGAGAGCAPAPSPAAPAP